MSKKSKNSNYKQHDPEMQTRQASESKKAQPIMIALAGISLALLIAVVSLGVNLASTRSDYRTLQEDLDFAIARAENLQAEMSEMQMSNLGPNPIVTIEMEDGQTMKVELYPEMAPNTVRNFVYLANQGFYDGLTFHRLIPGFMIQGGCPDGTGMGGPGHQIRGEFPANGFRQNTLLHTRGTISMARANPMDSAGSQFFLMHDDAPFLDQAGYAAFGRIIEGIEVVDDIVSDPTAGPPTDAALQPRAMRRVTVETFGVDWGEPEKLPGR